MSPRDRAKSDITITRTDEERACPECGAPLYRGDRAVYDGKADQVYCTRACAEQARKEKKKASK